MHVSWNDYGLQWRMLSLCKYVFPFNTKCNFVPVKWSLNSYVFLLSLERFIKLYRLSGYVGCFDNKWLFSSKQLLGKCFKMVFFFVAKGYTFWERAQTLSIVWLFATYGSSVHGITLWVDTIYFHWAPEKKKLQNRGMINPAPLILFTLSQFWA